MLIFLTAIAVFYACDDLTTIKKTMNKSNFMILVFCTALLCTGCINKVEKTDPDPKARAKTTSGTQPPHSSRTKVITVYLQPYNGFPEDQLLVLQADVQNCLDTLIQEKKFKVKTLNNRQLPAYCYYTPRNRYRADSIIVYQTTFSNSNYIVGVLNTDISCSAHGYADFGILGLGSCPGKTAVVSNHRVRNKSMFYKVAVHEFLHTLGMPHCSEDDRSCYMCDADGTPQLEKEVRLCESCRETIVGLLED